MKLVVATPEQTILPDGVYTVELLSIQRRQGVYEEQFVWLLRVVEGEHAGTEIRAWSNVSATVGSKTVKWASAFRGKPFREGETVDLHALLGKRARATVQNKRMPDGRLVARVTNIEGR